MHSRLFFLKIVYHISCLCCSLVVQRLFPAECKHSSSPLEIGLNLLLIVLSLASIFLYPQQTYLHFLSIKTHTDSTTHGKPVWLRNLSFQIIASIDTNASPSHMEPIKSWELLSFQVHLQRWNARVQPGLRDGNNMEFTSFIQFFKLDKVFTISERTNI